MTGQTYKRKSNLLRASFPKALRIFSPKASKRSHPSDDFTSSLTSITRSSMGRYSGDRRLADRNTSPTSSFGTSSSDEYVERYAYPPDYDDELEFEIKMRQNSPVKRAVNKYDQLDVRSKMYPPLEEIRGRSLSTISEVYQRVQGFEKIEADSKNQPGPSLEELRKRRESRPSHRKTTVLPPTLYTL